MPRPRPPAPVATASLVPRSHRSFFPYITTSVHDDLEGVMVTYGSPPTAGAGAIFYQLSTSASMIGLIVSMIGGVFALAVALVVGAAIAAAVIAGVAAAIGTFIVLG